MKKGRGFWFLQASGWILVLYLIYSQALPAFDYDLGVAMGTQDSAADVTEIGVAFWRGFAIADLVTYIPLLAIGLIGHFLDTNWGRIALAGALGITIYWPITCLTAVMIAQGAPDWTVPLDMAYWIVLPALMLWSLWGLIYIGKDLN